MRPTFLHINGVLYWSIYIYNPDTGVLKDADSTPSVSVRKNGAATGDSVTITKRSATTGIYDCSYNPSSEIEGDEFLFEESATVTGTSTAQATYNNVWSATVIATEASIDASGVRSAIGLASANLDTQLQTIQNKTNNLPSVPASSGDIPTISNIASGVWVNAIRTLTAGTNIVLVKNSGIIGFNDLDSSGIRSSVGLASANIDTQFSSIENKLPSGLINGSMRSYVYEIENDAINVAATDANLVSWIQEDLATSSDVDSVRVLVSGVKTKTDQLDVNFANIPSGVSSYIMPESYAANGAQMSLSQAMYMIHQMLSDFAISGVTISVKKLDGSEAASFTLNSSTRPTSKERTS